MNIYILVEISKREFDSNLLLAFLAALDGHEVVLSNFENYSFLNSISKLKPGVFHTKSILHGIKKKNFHESLKKKNFLITSIDEEASLINNDLTSFLETRFSSEALDLIDKVFCWGKHDYDSLKKKFPIHEEKFVLSGSPRMDLSKKLFQNFWSAEIKNLVDKNNILFALNFPVINGYIIKEKIFNEMKEQGFFERSKTKEQEYLDYIEDSNKSFLSFKDLINYLSKELKNHKLIVRPHPMEKTETWKQLLQVNSNVEISNHNDINYDLGRSKILIHNGCSSAFQSALLDIPILSYKSYKAKSDYGILANQLGKIISRKEDIKNEIVKLTNDREIKLDYYIKKDILNLRIHHSNKSLSSENILNTWKNFSIHFKQKKNDWKIIKLNLQIFRLFKLIKEYSVRILKPFKKKTENYYYRKKKFEELNIEDVRNKIYKFKKIFKKEEKIVVEKLSSKFFLIKKT
tara:strand:+ start:10014 stop:11396 length:1383 start_codon:yes stop_codon:yes gene_type:complete